jgi:hypothetical protein
VDDYIVTGRIPLNPDVPDYAAADGSILLWVKEEAESRSLYIQVSTHGEHGDVFEMRYDDAAAVAVKILERVALHDSNLDNELIELLEGTK